MNLSKMKSLIVYHKTTGSFIIKGTKDIILLLLLRKYEFQISFLVWVNISLLTIPAEHKSNVKYSSLGKCKHPGRDETKTVIELLLGTCKRTENLNWGKTSFEFVSLSSSEKFWDLSFNWLTFLCISATILIRSERSNKFASLQS